MQEIKRDKYLKKFISKKGNGLIKVITGIRRSGKSYLLFNIFKDYLINNGISDKQIISISLDDDSKLEYRNTQKLSKYIRSKIKDKNKQYYVLIDEIQYAITKKELKSNSDIDLYAVLNGLMRLNNVDIYVTGSNSKLLSKDILTEFRGRSDSIEVFPLTFKEYYDFLGKEKAESLADFSLYGGMPFSLSLNSEEEKINYLRSLFTEVYFKDISERYDIEYPNIIDELTNDLCSSIGSLTNSTKISKTLNSVKGIKVSSPTISTYLEYLTESFLFRCAQRYDIKGKQYFSYPLKYYCVDVGLRNARLNFRQIEETHIMENIIYNELICRGYAVDIGVIDLYTFDKDKNKKKIRCEIDFIVNKGAKKYYIQSALNIDDPLKQQTEIRPLLATKDFFKKFIITKTFMKPWQDNQGIIHIGIYDFLLNEEILDSF